MSSISNIKSISVLYIRHRVLTLDVSFGGRSFRQQYQAVPEGCSATNAQFSPKFPARMQNHLVVLQNQKPLWDSKSV